MPDDVTLDRRLRAVERSLTDGDLDIATVREAGRLTERVETLETELADARDRIAELEAVTQALRGYVGNVRSVNEDVERRADAALAAVERLEDRSGDRDRTGVPGARSTRAAVDGGTESPLSDESRPPTSRARTTTPETGAPPQTTASRTTDRGPPSNETRRDGEADGGSDADAEKGSIVQRVRDVL